MSFRTIPFFITTHGLTWAFWIPLAILQWPANDFPGFLLLLLGGLGVPVAAVLFVSGSRNRAYIREYWTRIIDPRRISPGWWAGILLLPLLVTLSGVLIGSLLTGQALRIDALVDAQVIAGITLFYVMVMLLAPLLEEVAWRGYGQDSIQSSFGLATASLVLGLLWWVWHLPLFFMADTYQSGLGVFTVPFWEFLVSVVATAFVMTWIFNSTRGSILAAILYHFVLNVASEVFLMDLAADLARAGVQVALAAFVYLALSRTGRFRMTPWKPRAVQGPAAARFSE
jgi:uncharacterized protein